MQAHTVVILTSGLAHATSPDALDRAIEALLKIKKTPFLVLGRDGDEILERCSRLEDCELVFDPNQSIDESGDDSASGSKREASEFSGVKAGLHATNTAAFVWRIDQPFPSAKVWTRLETALRLEEQKASDVLSVEDDPSGLLLVTPRGNKHLKERPAASPWPKAQDIVFTPLS